ncbi:sigma-70 family RNA polymerase sigma factor [Siminovitchia fortis]|uniref:Sigma-70 family RNA polymerase sigma factor n=1 Tax=Siminovitchia fortis TaxID=254758 RepID=A0A443IM87_9BACI|nr:sigma-70 family RNA polymerase sigma factor [Siminovitchia fortis]RWR06737.1 sigma-70 family RNA polymerase sigma factor [Siminovitchia fortis]WHY83005.1 sigma-70 family RNA polymerase sigma factor [Siminovitchia fortis]
MWIDKMIIEYEEGRKDLYKIKDRLGESQIDKMDRTQVNGMINDMSFAIDWMRTGRRPGNLRGIDRRSAYQRRILVDMDLMPSLDIQPEPRELGEDEKQALVNMLIDLSHRERQCYLLHMAQGWSMQEIADELGISKPSVQVFIKRAKNKIKRKLSCHTNVI